MKKESLSFLVVFLVGALTVLTVLFVQAKRESLKVEREMKAPEEKSSVAAAPAATTYPLPKERVYTSTIQLPSPNTTTGIPLDKAINTRRSRRAYSEQPVTLSEISQMLWSGQGVTDPQTGKRTSPSARESYSMTLFVVIKSAQGLEPGVYEYLPKTHSLGKVATVDMPTALVAAGVQPAAQQAPVVFLVASSFGKYQQVTKSPNVNATYMEAGHIGQNMYLEAESLGMGTVAMAGFDGAKVATAFQIDPAESILYVFPFGHRGVEAVEEK
jgi:SagB-type dehydrogenase family enzyme